MENWIKLKSYYIRSEADVDKGFLDSAKINSFVKGADLSGARPFLNETNPIEILVDPSDLERAKEVVGID